MRLGGRVHQCEPFGPCIWREETQFYRTAFLGERVLRLDRRSGRSGDTGVHQKPGAGGQSLGANEFVALIGHLQVANKCRIASAILTAASSGPIPKAPGSAGGYLPSSRLALTAGSGTPHSAASSKACGRDGRPCGGQFAEKYAI